MVQLSRAEGKNRPDCLARRNMGAAEMWEGTKVVEERKKDQRREGNAKRMKNE
jgi:hypothetical protein